MAKHNLLGTKGEEAAVCKLICEGYVILHRNWRVGKLELDIVARKDNLLVIAEVKTRQSDRFGPPEDAVDNRKIRKLMNAAEAYIKTYHWNGDVRFDIFSVLKDIDDELHVEHIADAFYPPIN